MPKYEDVFYEPNVTEHGLPRNPFKSCVVPRPIGWISTISAEGVPNLAPYSQFQNATYDPPYVLICANWIPGQNRKDTCRNIEETGEFVWNMATYDLREAVNKTAALVKGDEFEFAGLTKEPSKLVKPWRVKESPIQFECKLYTSLHLPGASVPGNVDIIVGRVIGVHIASWALNEDGLIDLPKIKPIARCGYYQYTVIDRYRAFRTQFKGANVPGGNYANLVFAFQVFDMIVPTVDEDEEKMDLRDRLAGLEGAPARGNNLH